MLQSAYWRRAMQAPNSKSRFSSSNGFRCVHSSIQPRVNKLSSMFSDNPQPVFGVAGALAAVIGTLAYRDYWIPYLEAGQRFGRSVWAAGVISWDYKYGRKKLEEHGMSASEADHTIHQRSAERLLSLFKTQGGVYVKAGQHMSSLYYLLPNEYCAVLEELHHKATSRPLEELLPVLREQLGASPTDYFDSFDAVPVAAASIAQVHKASYKGIDVAVKVQFPDVDRLSGGDVRTIEIITNFITWAFPEFKLKWLVREFDNNLPLELDFQNEAANSNRIRKLFVDDPFFCTPKIFEATKKVLIMEWIDGVHINEVEKLQEMGISTQEVAKHLNRVFSEQIFVHRFLHCDPHAGNVLVRKCHSRRRPFQICLLDNGLYREYTEEFCLNYAQLWLAILSHDEDLLSRCAQRMGVAEHRLFASILTARTWESIQHKLLHGVEESEFEHIKSQAADRAAAITEVLAQVPSPLLLVLKTNDLLRSLNLALGAPTLKVFSATIYACQTALQNYQAKFNPGMIPALSRLAARWNLNLKVLFLTILSFIGILPSTL